MCEKLKDKGILNKIIAFSKKHYDDSFDHGWPHIQRVLKLAKKLAVKYDVNECVLIASTYLHDIGRKYEKERGENHAVISANLTQDFLEDLGICKECIENVRHAILAHSYTLKVEPKTIEAKIISDADKIDALGAVGIVRAIMFGEKNRRNFNFTINHFFEKLFKLEKHMHLEESKKLAKKRIKYMYDFINQLKKELD